ncbi:F-box-like protein [Ceratobasidium sp. AG-Ba]|nr:F-box-like protein [Ceratobasidium sp. AG-Ba]QRW12050.1 F-box-like protein [Ceratobasidium sp. AG-Ba]
MWAQSTRLEHLVSIFIKEDVQERFRTNLLQYLSTRPPPGYTPILFEEEDNSRPSQEELDRALHKFEELSIDWSRELELFKRYTQWITQLNLSSKSMFATRIIYILQRVHPAVVRDILPRLTSVVFSGDLYPFISTIAITGLSSLRHVTFEVSRFGPSLKSWIQACRPAVNLTGLTMTLHVDERGHQSLAISELSSSLQNFLLDRKWKEIELPGQVIKSSLLQKLGEVESLETLVISGPIYSKAKGDTGLDGVVFKSLRTLRMIGFSGGDYFPRNAVFPNVEHLVLDFVRPTEGKEEWCPVQYLAAMARACPKLVNLEVSIPSFQDSELTGLTDLSFEPLFALSRLARLVVRTSRVVPISLTDDFLSRAAQAWPNLQELDIDIVHSTRSLITLQGLAPLGQYCLKLRLLRIGLRLKYVNTVFNPELYGPNANESDYVCALRYLDVGCPSVYGSAAVSAFLSTIFPNLRYIECPEAGNCDLFNEGDHFVWTQVIKTVCQADRDRDIDGLAQMLRRQDLRKKLEGVEKGSGSCHEDLVQSSDYDSDDYWAYSGSECDTYSDSESDD